MLLGIVLIVISKNNEFKDDIKSVGHGLLLAGFALILPTIVRNYIVSFKEQAIVEYLEGEVEVIQHSDSTYTFLWIDCD
jgi:hypothetical protein